MNGNICKFIPKAKSYEPLHIINLVYETENFSGNTLVTNSTYCLYIVTEGEGKLHTIGNTVELGRGDVFLTVPAMPFGIENISGLKFIYISYLGIRANMIAETFKINRNRCVFKDFEALIPMWESLFNTAASFTDIKCESVLLFTFSEIGNSILSEKPALRMATVSERIKKYIDDNLFLQDLNLELIAQELSYNKKYISTVFKKEMGVGISQYIITVRIQHACNLMEQGFTAIKDISALCGFRDPLYFSKVFKERMAKTPKQHIKKIKTEKN